MFRRPEEKSIAWDAPERWGISRAELGRFLCAGEHERWEESTIRMKVLKKKIMKGHERSNMPPSKPVSSTYTINVDNLLNFKLIYSSENDTFTRTSKVPLKFWCPDFNAVNFQKQLKL